jgi:hypothetical protein
MQPSFFRRHNFIAAGLVVQICRRVILNRFALGVLLGLLFATSSSAQNHTVLFKTTDPGVTKSIGTWGMDTTWASADNMRDGMIFMGSNQVDVIRVGFMVADALTNGQLSANAKSSLDDMASVANSVGIKPWMFSPNTQAGVNAWFKNGSDVISANWVQAMDAAKLYLGKTNILWAEPFNEPDYSGWNEGPSGDLYNIMGLLQTDTNFNSTLLAGGSTLDVDNAVGWYDAVKSRAAIGTTHCLGGSFASYTNWMQDVRSSGGFCLNPEVHNLVEVIAGAQYGLQGAIWWGDCTLARGLFVQSCQGSQLAYAEDQGQWTAAAVYRAPDGAVRGFVGSAERQGTTTSYQFLCQDRDVWFNGVGPQRSYTVTIPQNGEAYVDINWSADIPLPIYGKYVLVAKHSGKVMEVAGAGLNDGANVQQNTYIGGDYQKWDIMPDGNGFYTIKAAHSGKTAEDQNFSTGNGGNIDQWGAGENANQHWFFEYVGDGYYSVRNRYSGLYLDVSGSNVNNGANIDQWAGTGGANQQWRLVPTGNWTKVDDNDASIAYSANWGGYFGNPGYQNTEHFCQAAGGTATYTFTGNQARYYGFLRNDLGIATIYLDGVLQTNVDCYSATAAFNQLLYQTPMLTYGTHTLMVQASGNKNAASSSLEIIVDAFESFVSTPVNFSAPTAPIGLTATANQVSVNLNWQTNSESDLASYSIFRSLSPGGPYNTLAMGVTNNAFTDKSANQAYTFYYVVKAVNQSAGQSPYSAAASATPGGAPCLVAQYAMEGNLADSSGNANNGVLTGPPVYAAGKYGSAISLDGVTNYVALPAGMVNFNNLTVTAWVYWNGGANWQRIFDFGNDTAHNLFLTPQSGNNTLRFGTRNGGTTEQDLNTATLPANQWAQVAVTLGNNIGKLYVNGQLQDTETITYRPSNFNPVNVWIGKSEWGDPLFSGLIDDFRIYNYALSAAQIANVYNPANATNGYNAFTQTVQTGSPSAPLSVQMSGVMGRTYILQRALSLTNPIWVNVFTNGPLFSNQSVLLTDPAPPTGSAFYRTTMSLP